MKEELINDLDLKFCGLRDLELIEPCLLVINEQYERLLFTEGVIPKNESAEDFAKNRFGCELIVIKDHEICFFGKEKTQNSL